jgi:hypothetical protein
MFLGLPLRTTSTTTDSDTSPCVGPLAHEASTNFGTSFVMSGSMENVT